MALITVYYDEYSQEILTMKELIKVANEYTIRNGLHLDRLSVYDLNELWEMLRPDIQEKILSEERQDYIENNCILKVIKV